MRPALPEPIDVTIAQQLKMLESAPAPAQNLQWRRVQLLSALDRFDEALTICEMLDPGTDAGRKLLHAQLLQAPTRSRDPDRSEAMMRDLLTIPLEDRTKTNVLLSLSQSIERRGNLENARAMVLDALDLDAQNTTALRRYAVLEAALGQLDDLLHFSERRIAAGNASSLVIAACSAALAGLQRVDEAQEVRRFEELFWCGTLPCPSGSDDLVSFNRDLAAELRTHPALRFENSRRASKGSWRIDELFTARSEHVRILLETICTCAQNYIESVVDSPTRKPGGLFDELRPGACKIASWAILTREDGYEDWHMHGRGWISGVYYVAVPDGLPGGSDKAGAIDFGWWEEVLGDGASERLGYQRVHPEPGMLLLFPSYIHHRTWPHRSDEERICVAFDIMPS
ncbi:hypothetical protein FIU90_12890 [Erythrobacter sp. THAF29]|nr:hypothetical protein FIU90_12890 [Erythrobacter sp. THAF29]